MATPRTNTFSYLASMVPKKPHVGRNALLCLVVQEVEDRLADGCPWGSWMYRVADDLIRDLRDRGLLVEPYLDRDEVAFCRFFHEGEALDHWARWRGDAGSTIPMNEP